LADPAPAALAQSTATKVSAARSRALAPARVCGIGRVVGKSAVVSFAAAALAVDEGAPAPGGALRWRLGLFLVVGLEVFVRLRHVLDFRAGAAPTRAAGRAATGAAVG
jgi:hypothetical protein